MPDDAASKCVGLVESVQLTKTAKWNEDNNIGDSITIQFSRHGAQKVFASIALELTPNASDGGRYTLWQQHQPDTPTTDATRPWCGVFKYTPASGFGFSPVPVVAHLLLSNRTKNISVPIDKIDFDKTTITYESSKLGVEFSCTIHQATGIDRIQLEHDLLSAACRSTLFSRRYPRCGEVLDRLLNHLQTICKSHEKLTAVTDQKALLTSQQHLKHVVENLSAPILKLKPSEYLGLGELFETTVMTLVHLTKVPDISADVLKALKFEEIVSWSKAVDSKQEGVLSGAKDIIEDNLELDDERDEVLNNKLAEVAKNNCHVPSSVKEWSSSAVPQPPVAMNESVSHNVSSIQRSLGELAEGFVSAFPFGGLLVKLVKRVVVGFISAQELQKVGAETIRHLDVLLKVLAKPDVRSLVEENDEAFQLLRSLYVAIELTASLLEEYQESNKLCQWFTASSKLEELDKSCGEVCKLFSQFHDVLGVAFMGSQRSVLKRIEDALDKMPSPSSPQQEVPEEMISTIQTTIKNQIEESLKQPSTNDNQQPPTSDDGAVPHATLQTLSSKIDTLLNKKPEGGSGGGGGGVISAEELKNVLLEMSTIVKPAIPTAVFREKVAEHYNELLGDVLSTYVQQRLRVVNPSDSPSGHYISIESLAETQKRIWKKPQLLVKAGMGCGKSTLLMVLAAKQPPSILEASDSFTVPPMVVVPLKSVAHFCEMNPTSDVSRETLLQCAHLPPQNHHEPSLEAFAGPLCWLLDGLDEVSDAIETKPRFKKFIADFCGRRSSLAKKEGSLRHADDLVICASRPEYVDVVKERDGVFRELFPDSAVITVEEWGKAEVFQFVKKQFPQNEQRAENVANKLLHNLLLKSIGSLPLFCRLAMSTMLRRPTSGSSLQRRDRDTTTFDFEDPAALVRDILVVYYNNAREAAAVSTTLRFEAAISKVGKALASGSHWDWDAVVDEILIPMRLVSPKTREPAHDIFINYFKALYLHIELQELLHANQDPGKKGPGDVSEAFDRILRQVVTAVPSEIGRSRTTLLLLALLVRQNPQQTEVVSKSVAVLFDELYVRGRADMPHRNAMIENPTLQLSHVSKLGIAIAVEVASTLMRPGQHDSPVIEHIRYQHWICWNSPKMFRMMLAPAIHCGNRTIFRILLCLVEKRGLFSPQISSAEIDLLFDTLCEAANTMNPDDIDELEDFLAGRSTAITNKGSLLSLLQLSRFAQARTLLTSKDLEFDMKIAVGLEHMIVNAEITEMWDLVLFVISSCPNHSVVVGLCDFAWRLLLQAEKRQAFRAKIMNQCKASSSHNGSRLFGALMCSDAALRLIAEDMSESCLFTTKQLVVPNLRSYGVRELPNESFATFCRVLPRVSCEELKLTLGFPFSLKAMIVDGDADDRTPCWQVLIDALGKCPTIKRVILDKWDWVHHKESTDETSRKQTDMFECIPDALLEQLASIAIQPCGVSSSGLPTKEFVTRCAQHNCTALLESNEKPVAKPEATSPTPHDASLPLNIVVVGVSGCGKTCLAHRYINNDFPRTVSTCGFSLLYKKGVKCCGGKKEITHMLYDTAGQEACRTVRSMCFPICAGVMVVCDAKDEDILKQALMWKDDIIAKTGAAKPSVLLINKCDVTPPKVSRRDLDNFCAEHGFIGWFETSALTGENVTPAFMALVDYFMEPKK